MTKEEAIICKIYLEDLDKHHTCNEYKLLMGLLKQEPCTDAISRQAVTDTTICEGISCNECSFNTCEDGQSGCLLKERVNKLPSVKPQYTEAEIQKMQDLESAEIQKAYEIGKDEGSSDFPNKWIPVSEKLPEEDGKYYVTLENECVKILGYATVQTLRYPKGFYYVTDDGFAWRL